MRDAITEDHVQHSSPIMSLPCTAVEGAGPEMRLEISKSKTWRHSPLIVLTATCFFRTGDLTHGKF